jgi:hypothetical protein
MYSRAEQQSSTRASREQSVRGCRMPNRTRDRTNGFVRSVGICTGSEHTSSTDFRGCLTACQCRDQGPRPGTHSRKERTDTRTGGPHPGTVQDPDSEGTGTLTALVLEFRITGGFVALHCG